MDKLFCKCCIYINRYFIRNTCTISYEKLTGEERLYKLVLPIVGNKGTAEVAKDAPDWTKTVTTVSKYALGDSVNAYFHFVDTKKKDIFKQHFYIIRMYRIMFPLPNAFKIYCAE